MLIAHTTVPAESRPVVAAVNAINAASVKLYAIGCGRVEMGGMDFLAECLCCVDPLTERRKPLVCGFATVLLLTPAQPSR